MSSGTSARLTVSLSGVNSALLCETLTQLSAATVCRTASCAENKPNYPQRYAPRAYDQLRLGFVSADASMGEWGRTVPILFSKTFHSEAFTVVLSVSPTVAESFTSFGFLPIRLVIVDEPLLIAAAAGAVTPGAAIAAVENLQSNPDTLPLVQKPNGEWFAEWNVYSRPLRFTPAAEQFPFLAQLASARVFPAAPRAGPLLSLTLYANDPRVRYDRETWLAGLPSRTRDAVMFMQREASAGGNGACTVTTTMEVEDIFPVQCDGCCWYEGHLPTPAPMERQMHAVRKHNAEKKDKKKKKSRSGHQSNTKINSSGNDPNDNNNDKHKTHAEKKFHICAQSAASAASDTSAASSFTMAHRKPLGKIRMPAVESYSVETVEDALQRRGWCVQPLHRVNPITPFSWNDEHRTMCVWHVMVNVAPLDGRGLQIEAAMPIPIYDTTQEELSEDSSCTTFYSSPTSDGCKNGKARLYPTPVNDNYSIQDSSNTSNNVSVLCREKEGKRFQSGNYNDAVIGVRWIRGVAVLQPPMFKQHTSSTLTVPICFTDTIGSNEKSGGVPVSYWQTVYLQYLFVFPFEDLQRGGNTLEVVRSLGSLDRLSTKKLVGHRGLGKTYTRDGDEEEESYDANLSGNASGAVNNASNATSGSFAKKRTRQIIKLAENTLESLNAAHRRGCEMVEFDVMLTRDRVPVIFHDPMIQLQAREKRWANPIPTNGSSVCILGYSPSFTSFTLEPVCDPDASDSVRTHSFCTMGSHSHCPSSSMGAYQFYMQNVSNYSSITLAMHQLTKRQLDLITTETFTHDKAENKLRNLLLRHWHQILRVYRNRQRKVCIESLRIKPRPVDGEFSGCLPNDEKCSLQENDEKNYSESASSSKALHASEDYYKRFLRNPQGIRAREEDVTNRICTLKDLFEETLPSLRFDLEVKFPFQPIKDSNLFLQIDAFEINAFVDTILNDVFHFADQRQRVQNADGSYTDLPRDVIFSSFEPDICIALKTKQSRFDVVFLCDTATTDDLKDYRSFAQVEGTLQFSILMHLSGISICGISLCERDQAHFIQTKNTFRAAGVSPGADAGAPAEDWRRFDTTRGAEVVRFAHAHGQRVWTWGRENSDERFTHVQSRYMNVDAIISDNVPLWSCASVEAEADPIARTTLST